LVGPDPSRTDQALDLHFDVFSSREPALTPDQARGRLSLENAFRSLNASA